MDTTGLASNAPLVSNPLDRPRGKFWVDNSGSARYSFGLEAPPGTGEGNTPGLSFEYSQGNPNGLLGQGWMLSGSSVIQRAPRSLVLDGVNAPVTYGKHESRFAIDGVRLLNVSNPVYDAPGSKYRAELYTGQEVTLLGETPLTQAFSASDANGRQVKYGTTTDSRALSGDGKCIREWYLKTNSDIFGNCMTFNYTRLPRDLTGKRASETDPGTTYLDSIEYSSNESTSPRTAAYRFVDFYYDLRNDPVVVTGAGDVLEMKHRLARIGFTAQANASSSNRTPVRAYNLSYSYSTVTGASQLDYITEEGADGVTLAPTKMKYTASLSNDWFQHAEAPIDLSCAFNSHAAGLLPLNITGKALSDLGCLCKNTENGMLSVKTFLANITQVDDQGHSKLAWQASTSEDGMRPLPLVNSFSEPKIMNTDLTGDGKSDIVLAYNTGSGLSFCLLKGTGTGFASPQIIPTSFDWDSSDRFIAMDCNGNGHVDVVQITSVAGKILFRFFYSRKLQSGDWTMGESQEDSTDDDSANTVQWLAMDVNRDGLQDLVRIWYDEVDGSGVLVLKATAYVSTAQTDKTSVFIKGNTTSLGSYTPRSLGQVTILPCDLNADGIQDLVTCQLEQSTGSDTLLSFKYNVFLCDGAGGFVPRPEVQINHIVSGQNEPIDDAQFQVLDFDGAGIPSLVFMYTDIFGTKNALVARGNYSAGILDLVPIKVANMGIPSTRNMTFTTADLNGSGKAGWLAWSVADKSSFSVNPIYNIKPLGDALTSVTDPLGLQVSPEYRPLSLPEVYQPDMEARENLTEALRPAERTLPTEGPFVNVLGSSRYVVSRFTMSNTNDLNAFKISKTTRKLYAGALIDLGGRGWQGFSRISSVDEGLGTTRVERFSQKWPLTGNKIREDLVTGEKLVHTSAAESQILKSQIAVFEAKSTAVNSQTVYLINQVSDATTLYESRIPVKTVETVSTHDSEGSLLSEKLFIQENGLARKGQKFKYFSYLSFNGLKGVLGTSKTTTVEANTDLLHFQEGDMSLTTYSYDQIKNVLEHSDNWSIQQNAFLRSSYQHDSWGNRIQSINPAGLCETLIIDSIFNTFPLRKTQTATIGPSFNHVSLYAFDSRFGVQTGEQRPNGQVSLAVIDGFGRKVSTRIGPVQDGNGTPSTGQPTPKYVVGDDGLLRLLESTNMAETERFSYGYTVSGDSRWPWRAKTLEYQPGGTSVTTVVTDYINCNEQVARSTKQQGPFPEVWLYRDFDSGGRMTSESVPLIPPRKTVTDSLTWYPSEDDCKRYRFDMLGRPVVEIQPRPASDKNSLLTTIDYSAGGNSMTTTGKPLKPGRQNPEATQLFRREVVLVTVGGGTKVQSTKSITAGSESLSSFTYDGAGRLNVATDPGLKKDISNYDLQGFLISMDNEYQNPLRKDTLAKTFSYNAAGRVQKETNASGETINYEYDALGRTVLRTSSDGRNITYQYDKAAYAIGQISSVTVSKPKSSDIESEYRFEYNAWGQPTSTTLTLDCDGLRTYKIGYVYDLQSQLVEKVLPDGTKVKVGYAGSRITSTTMEADVSTKLPWSLTADFKGYDVHDLCTSWSLRGTGAVSTEFTAGSGYDNVGMPAIRWIAVGPQNRQSMLREERYFSDELGRLVRCYEPTAHEVTSFTYLDGRLETASDTAKPFNYNKSGNLASKGGIDFTYSSTGVTGTTASQGVFEVKYDDSGRMVSRTVNSKTTGFAYDSFGKMSRVTNPSDPSAQSTQLWSDFLGRSLAQKNPDGSLKVNVSKDYRITYRPDGTQFVERFFYGPESMLASISTTIPTTGSTSHGLSAYFTNTKSNITHIYDTSGTLRSQMKYDAFGMLLSPPTIADASTLSASYESQSMDGGTGLLDFGARYYDPVLGRFTTPDDYWSADAVAQTDVMNRYAFENNDPINNIDPTGHWSWEAIVGALIGGALIVAGIAFVALTAGTGTPLVAALAGLSAAWIGAISGTLTGAGFAGLAYSAVNREVDGGAFWKGWLINVAVGAVTGFFVGGAAGAFTHGVASAAVSRALPTMLTSRMSATAISYAGRGSQFALRAFIGSGASVGDQLAFNWVQRDVVGDEEAELTDGLGLAAITGGVFGGLGQGLDIGLEKAPKFFGRIPMSMAWGEGWQRARSMFLSVLERSKGLACIADGINMAIAVGVPEARKDGPKVWL